MRLGYILDCLSIIMPTVDNTENLISTNLVFLEITRRQRQHLLIYLSILDVWGHMSRGLYAHLRDMEHSERNGPISYYAL